MTKMTTGQITLERSAYLLQYADLIVVMRGNGSSVATIAARVRELSGRKVSWPTMAAFISRLDDPEFAKAARARCVAHNEQFDEWHEIAILANKPKGIAAGEAVELSGAAEAKAVVPAKLSPPEPRPRNPEPLLSKPIPEKKTSVVEAIANSTVNSDPEMAKLGITNRMVRLSKETARHVINVYRERIFNGVPKGEREKFSPEKYRELCELANNLDIGMSPEYTQEQVDYFVNRELAIEQKSTLDCPKS